MSTLPVSTAVSIQSSVASLNYTMLTHRGRK